MWKYALHKVPRVRTTDMSFGYDSSDDAASPHAPAMENASDFIGEGVPLDAAATVTSRTGPDYLGLHGVFVADESEDDDAKAGHGPSEWFKLGDRCVVTGPNIHEGFSSASVAGRIVGHTSRRVQKYIIQGIGGWRVQVSPECVHPVSTGGIMNALDAASGVDDANDAASAPEATAAVDDEGEEDDHGTVNESGQLAETLQGRVEAFDVGKMSAFDIWNRVLLRRDLSGGMLTRSILIAAASDAQCLPLWPFATAQEKLVEKKRLQGLDFIQHFTSQHKIEWLRVKLFSIVSSNRNTYARVHVSFNGCTSLTLAAVSGVELTDDLRCRIAHLALDARTIKLLSLIFGSRDTRDKHDDKGLSGPALWDQLTRDYVNSTLWQPYSAAADSFHACCSLDPSAAPAKPGLQVQIVQDIFLEIRSEWTRLDSRVSSPTGCNSTGDALLKSVWESFINGGRLKFTRPTVTMYVFVSWKAAGKDLPELCNRQLAPHQRLSLGVPSDSIASSSVMTPQKAASSSTPSPKSGGRGNAGSAVV